MQKDNAVDKYLIQECIDRILKHRDSYVKELKELNAKFPVDKKMIK